MRTKALLLTAALTAAGFVSSQAQSNVYSLNVVGYVNVVVPAVTNSGGFAMVANPLNNSDNTLSTILPNPPLGTKVYIYNGTGFTALTFALQDDNTSKWGPNTNTAPFTVLAPGTGFFVRNPSNGPTTLTFVGEVEQGTLNIPIVAGFNLVGSKVPQLGQLDVDLGYVPTAGSTREYKFTGSGYQLSSYSLDDFGNPVWNVKPTNNVAEGFWIRETSATNWTRNFQVQ